MLKFSHIVKHPLLPLWLQRGRYYFVLLLLLVILPACNLFGPKEYKIGLAINLSGTGGTASEYIRDGALLAVKEINQSGGINGKPLRLLIEDDKGTAQGAIEAVNKLIDSGVFAIIGHSHSDTTLASYPHVMSRNMLMITAYTATNKLTGKDDYFFRTSVDTTQYGLAMANLLKSKKIEHIVFVVDTFNSAFGEEFYAETIKNISVKNSTIKIKTRDVQELNDIANQIIKINPQAVCFLTEVTRTGLLAQKLRNRGFKGEFIATLWAQTSDLIKVGGDAVTGISIITFVDSNLNTPEYQAFVQKLKNTFAKSSPERSMRSYELVYILAETLKKSKSTNVDALKKALLTTKFNVLSGEIAFDSYGDVKRPIYAVTVQDAKFVKVAELN